MARRLRCCKSLTLAVALIALGGCGGGAEDNQAAIETAAKPTLTTPQTRELVTVGTRELKIVSAEYRRKFGGAAATRQSKLLIVLAEFVKGKPPGLGTWKVRVANESGKTSETFLQFEASSKPKGPIDSVFWVFAVPKTTRSPVLHLPRETSVRLAPFLRR